MIEKVAVSSMTMEQNVQLHISIRELANRLSTRLRQKHSD